MERILIQPNLADLAHSRSTHDWIWTMSKTCRKIRGPKYIGLLLQCRIFRQMLRPLVDYHQSDFISQLLLLMEQTCGNELFRTLLGEKLRPSGIPNWNSNLWKAGHSKVVQTRFTRFWIFRLIFPWNCVKNYHQNHDGWTWPTGSRWSLSPCGGERWITFYPLTISSWDGDMPTPNLQAYQYQHKHKLAKACKSYDGTCSRKSSLSEGPLFRLPALRQASTFNCWRAEDSFKRKSSVPKAHTKSMAFEKICVCLNISIPQIPPLANKLLHCCRKFMNLGPLAPNPFLRTQLVSQLQVQSFTNH